MIIWEEVVVGQNCADPGHVVNTVDGLIILEEGVVEDDVVAPLVCLVWLTSGKVTI